MRRISLLSGCLFAGLSLIAGPLSAQQQPPGAAAPPQAAPPPATPGDENLRPNYVLGAGDQVVINALEMEEISGRPWLIDGDGNINIPRLGMVKAAGLTVAQLEAKLVTLLRQYVREPQVTVNVVQYHAEPVFFEGSFQRPGIVSLQGRRTLIEMITAVGGLSPNAGRFITITRRTEIGTIQLPNAITSPDGKTMTVTISMASLRNDMNPAENIILEPYDVIRAEHAEQIYVDGAVVHVGGIELAERDSMPLTQLISLAGGFRSDADRRKVRVLRPVMNSAKRAEISVNVDRILHGQDADFSVLPNDLLYFPQKPLFSRTIGRVLLVAIPVAVTVTVVILR
jgi:polysaccharide export outer membrane protein